jgi:CRP/FNR family cyclic AMP-dependent transcriptional regulator
VAPRFATPPCSSAPDASTQRDPTMSLPIMVCRICEIFLLREASSDSNPPVDEPPPKTSKPEPGRQKTMARARDSSLPEDHIGALRPLGAHQVWPAGTILFRQGDRPDQLFVIDAGEVELIDETAGGRRIVQIVYAGSSIGDLPVLLETPCLYTAVTRTKTTTLSYSRETVSALLEADPQSCFLWLRLLSRRLDQGYRRHVTPAGHHALQRLSHFLIDEVEIRGVTRIDLTQRELASTLALGRQTVSRELGRLELLGLVERGRGQVRILDQEGLRALLRR